MAAHSILGAGVVVALLVGGCNGDGEGPAATPTTVAPTTTAAPTTTVEPRAAEEAAVTEAAKQARLARLNALVNPDDPTAIAALDNYYVAGSPARAEVDGSLVDLENEGWQVRPHPTVPESVTVEGISFDRPGEATVLVCIIDSGIVYEPGAAPDAGDAVVNDVVYAYRSEFLMTKVDGSWKLVNVTGIDEWQGVTACPASL
jgi:hypothetical protein